MIPASSNRLTVRYTVEIEIRESIATQRRCKLLHVRMIGRARQHARNDPTLFSHAHAFGGALRLRYGFELSIAKSSWATAFVTYDIIGKRALMSHRPLAIRN